MKDDDFLKIVKDVDPEIDQEISTTGFIDTGTYALNAVLSGSIYGGIANNRVTAFAGEEAVGKSWFAMSAVKQFLDDNPTGRALYFDTEFALDKTFFQKRGIDETRVHISQPDTLEDFRTKVTKILDGVEKMDVSERPKIMIVLDSLSNLPSKKEAADALEGSDKRDMTKQQIIRSTFRVITQKIGKLGIPLIVTSHVYQMIGAYVPTKAVSGGGGLKYAASTIVLLSSKKDKDGTDIVGNIIVAKVDKSRFSKQYQKVELKLDFTKGLDRFFGLLPIAEKYDIIKKVSTRYELADGSKVWGKDILAEPEKYFTKDILDKIDDVCKREYALGGVSIDEAPEEVSEVLEVLEEHTKEELQI